MIEAGRKIRKGVFGFFNAGPSGRHIVHTVLFTYLLPTVGFHVLSRTEHTDIVDSFWLRLNNVLHTSGHLKYQELYFFYAFSRSIMPKVILEDLYTNKPGALVARSPSFTAGSKRAYDDRGWTYVHLDEILEMVIIRLTKDLNQVLVPYLESAGAWLLEVSRARLLIRNVTAASRSFKRRRVDNDGGEEIGPLQQYDRNAVHSDTVRAMVQLMRENGFLSSGHRSSENLRNVFGKVDVDLIDIKLQKLILAAESHGKKTTELHACAVLPDVLGKLTDEDYEKEFDGKRFRGTWTRARIIPTVGTSMDLERKAAKLQAIKAVKDPKKVLSDRRLALNRLITALTLAEHAATNAGAGEGAGHARRRWVTLHSARYLMSALADAYRATGSIESMRHAMKSQILSALNLDKVQAGSEESELHAVVVAQNSSKSVSYYYDYQFPQYLSVMVDLMNHIWTRGTDGRHGNSMFQVTTLKLKHLLRPWFTGRRSRKLAHLHLHIDDPNIVIPQKSPILGRSQSRQHEQEITDKRHGKHGRIQRVPIYKSWEEHVEDGLQKLKAQEKVVQGKQEGLKALREQSKARRGA